MHVTKHLNFTALREVEQESFSAVPQLALVLKQLCLSFSSIFLSLSALLVDKKLK
jgi:hypothetical protein